MATPHKIEPLRGTQHPPTRRPRLTQLGRDVVFAAVAVPSVAIIVEFVWMIWPVR